MTQVLGSTRSVGRCHSRRRVPALGVGSRPALALRTVRASAAEEPRDPSGEPPKRPHPEMEGDDAAAASSSSSVVPDTLPYLGSQSDWREFRAKLVSQSRGQGPASTSADEWAHIIPKPEKGALLLAHPLLFQNSQTYFHRAAILLLEHGDTGSYGVILNRPSTYFIRDIPLKRPQEQFNDCRLYVGGDVGGGEVQVLHPHGDLAGAVEVVKGVYMGGLDAGRDAIDAGKAKAQDFRWFSAYAGWAPGQLAMECKRGVWFTAAASPKLLLKEVEHGQGPSYWHELMTLLGGDYAELSRGLRKHDDLDAPEPSS
ncbi:hypothetical protein HXX76_002512 [Chlamydomonas incerta]|uniref:Transcriptional regulator n=1 Tax=Chlamydomonas incerta TaxID=51695 RepID=A0A835TE63_CHLIN|nr:hypothetical protein HXX76_002512 [Chlamydomonas incerta]|eukprot:KAG2442426.1 hypothetical protein HXX76_002512 [Chlamydomonas incerta]